MRGSLMNLKAVPRLLDVTNFADLIKAEKGADCTTFIKSLGLGSIEVLDKLLDMKIKTGSKCKAVDMGGNATRPLVNSYRTKAQTLLKVLV